MLKGFVKEFRIVARHRVTGEPTTVVGWQRETRLGRLIESLREHHLEEFIQEKWSSGEITTKLHHKQEIEL